jgi:hypothetical protein
MVKSLVNCIRRKLTRNKRSIRQKLTRNKRSTGGADLTVADILGISKLIVKTPTNIPNVPKSDVPVPNIPTSIPNKPPKYISKINQVYKNGDTKLIVGIKTGNKDLINQALSYNPLCIKSKEGKTPLELAKENPKVSSDTNLIKYLTRVC